jgi:hypothetical protein
MEGNRKEIKMYESQGTASQLSPAIERVNQAEKATAELHELLSMLRGHLSPILRPNPRIEGGGLKDATPGPPMSPLAVSQDNLLRAILSCIQEVKDLNDILDL